MITILENLCKLDGLTATVIMQADKIEELSTADASHKAIAHAGKLGLTRAGISNSGSVYPVDAKGETSDALIMGQAGPVAHYRRDFKLAAAN